MTNKSIRDYINLIETAQREGVSEGTEQVYKVLAVDKSNALSKQVKLKVKASSLDEVFERLAISDWYPLEINGVEVINGKRLKQGVAEGTSQTWEVSYDYGPHMTKTVTVRAGSEDEARAKVEKAAEKKGMSIMINSVEPVGQDIAEEQLEETSPDAIAEISRLTRRP